MLFGMAEPVRRALIRNGRRVRVYLPVGELLPGMAYLIRRLMENTSNTSFLRQTYAEGKRIDALVAAPELKKISRAKPAAGKAFVNEPPLNFSHRNDRARFASALDEVQRRLGHDYPSWIAGGERRSDRWIESVNPSAPEEIVGRAAAVSAADVDEAIAAAGEFFPAWRATPAVERAAILFRAAAIMRERRVELAAWEVFEVGKGWREADADVIEAIDYLEYYGREMIRLAEPRPMQRLAGESDVYFYEPRGIAAVIAPWNFPLAIPTGMSAAALAAGNCVIFKPAEQSPVLGFYLVDILRAAGLPPLACQLLQGGGDIGSALVRHSAVHLIAFTGSRDVGLEILREASVVRPGQDHVKRVIIEMGGKNAIIVDADADLDDAIAGVIDSAFGYQGQKCSAASRLILVEAVHDRILERLVEAAKSLKIGATKDPRNNMGPLIEAAAKKRVQDYIALGKREGTCLLEMPAPADGYFVGPAIFAGIEPQHRLAQEEIFGPVLAVMRARDFEHALELANASPYALTGGVFSRSPAHIERARRAFRVGNLYINRGITGAVVGRQPFGGFKLSGIGSKAGGPDYLLQFLEPRTVSENTLRHGFVPPEELSED
jgi:RHH-type proline utilization regulon transcriptional repressor/proline dehydrogenase/delta 1-pyrroline-5-carboxylate dehydrogenase